MYGTHKSRPRHSFYEAESIFALTNVHQFQSDPIKAEVWNPNQNTPRIPSRQSQLNQDQFRCITPHSQDLEN